MIERHSAKDHDIPARQLPKRYTIGNRRFVYIGTEKFTIPQSWTYFQYLMLCVFTRVFGDDFLNLSKNKSVIKRLYHEHVAKNINMKTGAQYRLTNSDVYIISMASDLELLLSHNKLPEDLIKKLRSEKDDAMRGAVYEINCAAGFLRAGYEIEWLTGDSLPEFKATKGNLRLVVESKRRYRQDSSTYDINKEIRAIKKRIEHALSKNREDVYLIFMDIDLPPSTSKVYKDIYERLVQEYGDMEYKDTTITFTLNGYEHDHRSVEGGKTSSLIVKGDDLLTTDEIDTIVKYTYAKLPRDNGSNW